MLALERTVLALEGTLALKGYYFGLPFFSKYISFESREVYPDENIEMESGARWLWRAIGNDIEGELDFEFDEEKEVSLQEGEVELKTLTEICEKQEDKRDKQFDCLKKTVIDIRETNERKSKEVQTHLENLRYISESKTKSIEEYLTNLKETCEEKGIYIDEKLKILKNIHEETEKNVEAKLEKLTSTLEASVKTAQQQLETLAVAFATRERNVEKQLQQLSEMSEKRGEKIENELKRMDVVLERLEKNVE